MTPDERGVSEVLSYILVFSVVTVTIAFVLGNGVGAVTSTQQNARVDAATSGVAILDKSVQTVYQTGVPRRATELKPNGGTLSIGGQFDVDVGISRNGTSLFSYSRVSSRFTHTIDDQSVGLALGARFRSGPGRVAMIDDPPFLFNESRTNLPLVLFTGADSVSTGSPVQVVASSGAERLLAHRSKNSPYTVEIRIETTPARAAAWDRYFQRENLTAVSGEESPTAVDGENDPANGVVVYKHQTERVIIQRFTVDLSLR
ncbi:hypothetical protein BRD16_05410 [Halobacteriales archaeon SW_6_65_46]|nr:MAG: hypothetical protein BRD16_05410 [Halobacteriales archaeon SW_6_65_46]